MLVPAEDVAGHHPPGVKELGRRERHSVPAEDVRDHLVQLALDAVPTLRRDPAVRLAVPRAQVVLGEHGRPDESLQYGGRKAAVAEVVEPAQSDRKTVRRLDGLVSRLFQRLGVGRRRLVPDIDTVGVVGVVDVVDVVDTIDVMKSVDRRAFGGLSSQSLGCLVFRALRLGVMPGHDVGHQLGQCPELAAKAETGSERNRLILLQVGVVLALGAV